MKITYRVEHAPPELHPFGLHFTVLEINGSSTRRIAAVRWKPHADMICAQLTENEKLRQPATELIAS